MVKKYYNKKYWIITLICIIVTLAFPASFFIVGFSGDSNVLLGVGSIMMFFSIITAPILWIFVYPKTKCRRSFFNIIHKCDSVSISELSSLTGKSKKAVIRNIQAIIHEGYLRQYRFDKDINYFYNYEKAKDSNEPLILAKQEDEKVISVKCESCGATYIVFDKIAKCPYCGQFSTSL